MRAPFRGKERGKREKINVFLLIKIESSGWS